MTRVACFEPDNIRNNSAISGKRGQVRW